MNIIEFMILGGPSKKIKLIREKNKLLKNNNLVDINDYFLSLIDYTNRISQKLDPSYYENIIEQLVLLGNQKDIISFLSSRIWKRNMTRNTFHRDVIHNLYFKLDKYYNGEINIDIILNLFNYLKIEEKYELRKIIGKEKIEDMILNQKHVEFSCVYANNFKDCDINKFEDIVVNSQNAKFIYKFSKYVQGANISRLETALIKTKNEYYIYQFLMDIPGANVTRLTEVILELGNPEIICKLAKNKKVNILEFENRIININDPEFLYEFAKNEKKANFLKLEESLIKTRSIKFIKLFAENKNIKTSELSKLFVNIYSLKNFGFNIKDENILDYLEQCIDENLLLKYSSVELYIKFLIDQNIIYKNDVNNYLSNLNDYDRNNFVLMLVSLNKKIRKKTLKKDIIKEELHLQKLNKNNLKKSLTEEECLILINLSLTKSNILPSKVYNFKEVRENVGLYLELLKKCDYAKYCYYEDAFMGKISFEQADKYYKYYLDKKLNNKKLNDNFNKLLKFKYNPNKNH